MTDQYTCASRRALMTGASAAALIAAVAAETGIALANVADPYVRLGAAYFQHWNATNSSASDEIGDREFDAWVETCERMMAMGSDPVATARRSP